MRRGILVIVALAVTSIGGLCQTSGHPVLTQPRVALLDVRLSSTSFEGGTLDVLLSVYNPNPYDLDISQMTYSVIVDSAEVGNGQTTQRVLIKARDSAMVHLPVAFSWMHAASAGRILTANGSVLYEVKGAIHAAATKVGPVTIPFDQHGQFKSLQQSR
jgi:LEA14-like dessication related protein